MPKRKKLNLTALKVKSFVTSLDSLEEERVRGGDSTASCIPLCTQISACPTNPVCVTCNTCGNTCDTCYNTCDTNCNCGTDTYGCTAYCSNHCETEECWIP
jgi:hypothetical protein